MVHQRLAGPQRQRLILLERAFQRLLQAFKALARLFIKQRGEKRLPIGERAGGQRRAELRFALFQLCLLLALLLPQGLPLALEREAVVMHLAPAVQRRGFRR